jgi:hypothetical protein
MNEQRGQNGRAAGPSPGVDAPGVDAPGVDALDVGGRYGALSPKCL